MIHAGHGFEHFNSVPCHAKGVVVENLWCTMPCHAMPCHDTTVARTSEDSDLTQKAASDDPAHDAISPFRGGAVICHNNKTVMPLQLRIHVVQWHHKMSCHPGERRTEETTRQHLTWLGLKPDTVKCVKKVQIARKERSKRKSMDTCLPNWLSHSIGKNVHALT
jgi:hypothetical protein